VALPRIGFNDGSLLRRTLVHMGTFVLGSMAFIGLVSFVLVSIAKGIVSPRSESMEDDVTAATVASAGGAKPLTAPLVRPGHAGSTMGVKHGRTIPAAAPSKDD
jgi:hypothetical protein